MCNIEIEIVDIMFQHNLHYFLASFEVKTPSYQFWYFCAEECNNSGHLRLIVFTGRSSYFHMTGCTVRLIKILLSMKLPPRFISPV